MAACVGAASGTHHRAAVARPQRCRARVRRVRAQRAGAWHRRQRLIPNGASPGCSERSPGPGGSSRGRGEQSLASAAAHGGAASGGPTLVVAHEVSASGAVAQMAR
jgi:hypothetical protein